MHTQKTQSTLQLDQEKRKVFKTKCIVIEHLEWLFQREVPQHQNMKGLPTQQGGQMWALLSKMAKHEATGQCCRAVLAWQCAHAESQLRGELSARTWIMSGQPGGNEKDRFISAHVYGPG